MAFYKPEAGLDVKYLCSWDYRVGRICDMAFLRRPRAWRISCSWSQRILPRASPQNKRVKYLTLEGLHAREILGGIKTKSFLQSLRKVTSMRTSSAFGSGMRAADPGVPAVAPPAGHGAWNPPAAPGKKTNPHLRSWQPATKSIASHLCSVGRKCICKFGSSCWCSAVNRFCCTKALLFGLKLAKFSCIQHSSSHFREDFV